MMTCAAVARAAGLNPHACRAWHAPDGLGADTCVSRAMFEPFGPDTILTMVVLSLTPDDLGFNAEVVVNLGTQS